MGSEVCRYLRTIDMDSKIICIANGIQIWPELAPGRSMEAYDYFQSQFLMFFPPNLLSVVEIYCTWFYFISRRILLYILNQVARF
jgi:hypothetical protein